MTIKDDGGPAFPVNYETSEQLIECEGMSLRDYFAAKAMQAMITKSHGQDAIAGKKGVPLIATYAYEYADAMIAEKNK